jgi:adenylate cyclase
MEAPQGPRSGGIGQTGQPEGNPQGAAVGETVSGLRDLVQRPAPPKSRWPAFVTRLMRLGVVTADPDIARRQVFANFAIYATALNAFSHLVIGLIHDFRGLLPLSLYNLAFVVVPPALIRLHRHGEILAAVCLCTMIVVGHSFVVFALGYDSDLQVYFLVFGFLFFLFGVGHWRTFFAFYLAAFVMLIVTLKLGTPDGFLVPGDYGFRKFMQLQAFINAMLINGLGAAYTLASLSRAERDLARQVELSDALVDVLLPRAISARLKSGRETQIADHVENATVMFADQASFTPAAHSVGPDELVRYLEGVFSGFDALCERHGVEKIKTIGDSYMAAAGLGGEGRAGAVAVGRLALDLIDFMKDHGRLGRARLRLRIGIHSGPLVAGVIGDLRVSYDVWGNTVNIAQRMESHGQAGRIQVTSAFRALAGDAFVYEKRGLIDIKGAGETETWFLVGPAAPAA